MSNLLLSRPRSHFKMQQNKMRARKYATELRAVALAVYVCVHIYMYVRVCVYYSYNNTNKTEHKLQLGEAWQHLN